MKKRLGLWISRN